MPEQPLHTRLREAILTLDLAPGQRLSERGLEPDFGASRTPIRAALMRLEAEGLVRREAKAWTVTPIDIHEVRALYEYREVLETATVRFAAERAADDEVAMLVDLVRSADALESPEHSVDTGTSFHLELARLSGNEFLRASMESVLTRLYRTRWLEVQAPGSRERAHREHAALADALLARDAAAAELAMLEHLRGTGTRLIETLEANHRGLRARGIALLGGTRD